MTKKIVGLGEILWDVYPDEKHLGGATSNVAFHAGNLGEEPIVVSRIGSDPSGDTLLHEMESRGYLTAYIQRDPAKPTGRVRIELDEKGVPSFICGEDEAFDYLEWTEDLARLATEADAVFFGILAQRLPVSRRTIQSFLDAADHALKIFDPNLRDIPEDFSPILETSFQKADILKLNEDEEQMLGQFYRKEALSRKEFLAWLLEKFHLRAVCLTLGERGAFCQTENESVYSPGYSIVPVDTTGSGDAFIAALVVQWLRNKTLLQVLDFANAVGAFVATQKGAVPTYSASDIQDFLKSHQQRTMDPSMKEVVHGVS
ncbi:MAG: carbohydrate kinase [Calditrichaeota bacterium]|nr:carbohydrate kinase [Calditrichota bacterium]